MPDSSAPHTAPIGAETAATVRAKETYEQLLALTDRIGGAYVNAYQKIALGIGDAQDTIVNADRSDWLKDLLSMPAATAGANGSKDAAKRAQQLTDALVGMSTTIGLAYVDAQEKAAIAAAECHEALAPAGATPLVRTIASARADLMREIVGAYASTAQRILA
jgi:hypothetical protein